VTAVLAMKVMTVPMALMTTLTLFDHQLAKLVDGKNARNLMVFVVVLSDVLLIHVSSLVTMVPILKGLPKQNALKMPTKLSHGTKFSAPAPSVMMVLSMRVMMATMVLMTPLKLFDHQLVRLVDGKNAKSSMVSAVVL